MFNNMYNKMHSWICIIMYKCARMSASMLCVCLRVPMFSFVWKISTHFPCSGGLRPRSCEVHPAVIWWVSIVMECHGLPQQLDGLQWKIMENPENPMEILWKLDDLGPFPMEPPMILVASFHSLDYSNTKCKKPWACGMLMCLQMVV